MRDTFGVGAARGRVIGSLAEDGVRRLGVDRYRSLSVDDAALRIVSLRKPGWGTTSLAYGPFEPSAGTALGVFVLNGHNTAQAEPLGEPISTRVKRWLKGNEVEPWQAHLRRWLVHGRKAWTVRRFAHWVRIDHQTRRGTVLRLDENLAVGFTPTMAGDPTAAGCSFVMHATGADNGELWVAVDGRTRPVLPGVRNVPLHLVVVYAADRVIFLVGSVDGVAGLPPLPSARPVAVVPHIAQGTVYATIQQAVSGQIGFAADTRVYEVTVADVADWLTAEHGPTPASASADAGASRRWRVAGGVGLIRLTAEPGACFSVGFRAGVDRAWTFGATAAGWELRAADGDVVATADRSIPPTATEAVDVQLTDDGERVGVVVDGELVFGRWIADPRDGGGEGVVVGTHHGRVHSVDVYPRRVLLPPALRPSTTLPRPSRAQRTIVDDHFDGPPRDLHGRTVAGRTWTKAVGEGRFLVTAGDGLRVDATAATPLPGRVVYTLPCPAGGPFEQEIEVVPPGSGRGQGELGRAGVIFEQDDGDALIVGTWLDDGYAGASISSFFRLDGFEDLYDAIWTNMGDRIRWGRPYRLRVAFDGLVYEAFVDDELVLYRSLRDVVPGRAPLRVSRVGIVANWEWGTDTGSVFRSWRLRSGAPTEHPRGAGSS